MRNLILKHAACVSEDDVLETAGTQWIYCKCGRWIHKDSVEESVVDTDGDQQYCKFCGDKYTISSYTIACIFCFKCIKFYHFLLD